MPAVASAKPDEMIFTSATTEPSSLAILGLAPFGEQRGRHYIITTGNEHKALLEPLGISLHGDADMILPHVVNFSEGVWIPRLSWWS